MIAKKTHEQLKLQCELDDLVGFGFSGLLEAKERFDPAKGVTFKAFAYYRIRGAIIDGVRTMAYLPRRAHARLKAAITMDEECESSGEVRASTSDMQQDPHCSIRTIDAILGRTAVAFLVSSASYDDEKQEFASEDTPESLAIAEEQKEEISTAISLLSDRERLILHGFYIQNRTLEDIAKDLGMSKSWASRARSKALDRLRSTLEKTRVP